MSYQTEMREIVLAAIKEHGPNMPLWAVDIDLADRIAQLADEHFSTPVAKVIAQWSAVEDNHEAAVSMLLDDIRRATKQDA